MSCWSQTWYPKHLFACRRSVERQHVSFGSQNQQSQSAQNTMQATLLLLTVILLLGSNWFRTYRSTRQDLPTPCSGQCAVSKLLLCYWLSQSAVSLEVLSSHAVICCSALLGR